MVRKVDIAIVGAGIAGLWTFNRLKRAGFDVLLLERDVVGGGQSLASQGIIHGGGKYPMVAQFSPSARRMRTMPGRWRRALDGQGDVDLSAANVNANAQLLMFSGDLKARVARLFALCALGDGVRKSPRREWPAALRDAGFQGAALALAEPVLEIGSVVRALAEPFGQAVRRIDPESSDAPVEFLRRFDIEPAAVIVTAAAGNAEVARRCGHEAEIRARHRPLLQGMLSPAPFPLFAHFMAGSKKPVATVTTHRRASGDLVWYFGGSVAERARDADPGETIDAARSAVSRYLPAVDVSGLRWSTVGVDRVEWNATARSEIPDEPVVRRVDTMLYCWPMKLAFAPLLSDKIVAELEALGVKPSGRETDFSDLPPVGYAVPPWETATWTS